MATTPALLSIEEYLQTSYEPECEYVDGELIPKSIGTNNHARLQALIIGLLFRYQQAGLCQIAAEQSVRVRESVILIPDVCLLHPNHGEQGIITKPALLCVEVLSPSNRFVHTVRKCGEYIRWGVPACWIFDPDERQGWFYDAQGLHTVAPGGILRVENIQLGLSELWP